MSIIEAPPTFSSAKSSEVNLGPDTISQNGHHPLFPLDTMIKRIEEFNKEKIAAGEKGFGTTNNPHTSLSINNLGEMLGTPEKPVETTRLRQAMQSAEIKPHQYWINAFEAIAIEEALTRIPEVAEKRGRGKPFYPPPPEYVSIQEAKEYIGVKNKSTVVKCADRAGIGLLREHGRVFVPRNKLDELKAAKRQNRWEVSGDIDDRTERGDAASLDLGIPLSRLRQICNILGFPKNKPLTQEEMQIIKSYLAKNG